MYEIHLETARPVATLTGVKTGIQFCVRGQVAGRSDVSFDLPALGEDYSIEIWYLDD